MQQKRSALQTAFVLAIPVTLLGGSLLGGCSGGIGGNNGVPTPTPVPVPKIAFVSDASHNIDLYQMNLDGTQPTRLTSDAANDTQPSLSFDQTQVVFTSNRDGNSEIYKMDVATRDVLRLTTDIGASKPADDSPVFSFDNSKIVWRSLRGGKSNIWVMSATGANQRQLTNEATAASDPFWSPDNTHVGFIAVRGGVSQIVIVPLNGGSEQVLNINNSAKSHPRFNAAGDRIVFSQAAGAGVPVSQLNIVNADGTNLTAGPNAGSSNFDPCWSRDGQRIIWSASGGAAGGTQIFSAKPDGTDLKQLTTTDNNTNPSAGG